MLTRWWALFCWSYLTWTVLAWTLTLEQITVGAFLAALTATACVWLGPAARPWALLRPRRAAAIAVLAAVVLVRMVRANLSLSRRIWSRTIPLRSGMVVVPTKVYGDAALTAVGLLTSVIVDSQLVDLDRDQYELQYHAVWIDRADARDERDRINGPVEAYLLRAGLT